MATFTLNTGAKIPAVGLGTWKSSPGEVKTAVAHALKSGYRHIDAAFVYGNESEVGEGLKEAFDSGLKREEVFVTSKLWCTHHREPEKALDEGLKKLGLEYVDRKYIGERLGVANQQLTLSSLSHALACTHEPQGQRSNVPKTPGWLKRFGYRVVSR